jgi:hypothetical protein
VQIKIVCFQSLIFPPRRKAAKESQNTLFKFIFSFFASLRLGGKDF